MYFQMTVGILTDIFFEFLKMFVTFFRMSCDAPALRVIAGYVAQHCVNRGLSLLCMPPHTTHWLLPTNKSFFRHSKTYFYDEAAVCVSCQSRSFTKTEFCSVFCKTWMKAAIAGNNIHAFKHPVFGP